MATRPKRSELERLESYRIAFENSSHQPVIKAQVALFGYTEEKLDEGWQLFQSTQKVWQSNQQEDTETSDAYRTFDRLFKEQEASYSFDRKKLKAAFIWEPGALKKLGVTGEKPRAYLEVMDLMRVCYSTLQNDSSLQNKAAQMHISTEYINESLARIEAIQQARTNYLRETTESQAATELKDQAFAKLDRWMREYLAVARIALEEQPQLLEALGLLVRN